jgi:hypothetical protein
LQLLPEPDFDRVCLPRAEAELRMGPSPGVERRPGAAYDPKGAHRLSDSRSPLAVPRGATSHQGAARPGLLQGLVLEPMVAPVRWEQTPVPVSAQQQQRSAGQPKPRQPGGERRLAPTGRVRRAWGRPARPVRSVGPELRPREQKPSPGSALRLPSPSPDRS